MRNLRKASACGSRSESPVQNMKRPLDLGDAPLGRMPRRVRPMLSTLVGQPFDRAGWLFEIKWDGFRAIAEIEAGGVRLYSRNLLSFERRFPALVECLARLPHAAVLDGEVVVVD